MAAVAKATFRTGTFKAENGYAPFKTPQQQAGITTTVFSPKAFRAIRIPITEPHPGQARWPDCTSSSPET